MDVGKRVRQFRKIHNITTIELSKQCGISQSTISKLENGNRIPEPADEYLIELICTARKLNKEQLEALSLFLKTIIQEDLRPLSAAESD